MLKLEGLRWTGVALLAALLAAPEAAQAGGRAASTRSDGGVSSRGSSSGSSSHGSSSASRSSDSGGSGRVAVPRSGGGASGHGSPVAAGSSGSSRDDAGPRVAVPRTSGSDDRHPDRTRGRRPGRDGDRTIVIGGWWHDPWYYGPHYGFWSSWWYPWGPYYRDYGYGYYRQRGDDYDEGYGALDLDIWPEEAEIWIDGERVGVADDFDGFPSFLWLPHGTYDVVFYLPGFKTLARQYSIYRGGVIDVEDRLERGESIRPEDLQSTSTVHRDARLQRNREREEAARAREEWRERRERRPSAIEDEDLDDEDELEDARDDRGTAADAARLHLQVSPGDASVYLDGNFLGTGSELQQLSAGLVVAPGAHTLQVVRPGYESEDVSFDSDPGEALELNVTLDRE